MPRLPPQYLSDVGFAVGLDASGQGQQSVSDVGSSVADECLGSRRMSVNVAWMEHARCRDFEPEQWFPSGTGNGARQQARRAVSICEACPVIAECFEYGKKAARGYGVWGGILRSARTPGRGPIKHGTYAGYKAHGRRGIPACEKCRQAHREYTNAAAAKRRSA